MVGREGEIEMERDKRGCERKKEREERRKES